MQTIFFLLTIFFFLQRLLLSKLIVLCIALVTSVKLRVKRLIVKKLRFFPLKMWMTNFVMISYFILVSPMSIVWVDILGLIWLLVDPLEGILSTLSRTSKISSVGGNNNVWVLRGDKCQRVVNSMLHSRHFCYLSYKLFRKKSRKRWTIALLRFLYLTLSICAGIECQDTKKERKTRICEKSQLAMASELLARRAWRRVQGE